MQEINMGAASNEQLPRSKEGENLERTNFHLGQMKHFIN